MSHCALPVQGEVINGHQPDWPLIDLTLYGNRNETAKLAKRVKCALRTLPMRVRLRYVRAPEAWVEAEISRLPALCGCGEYHEGWMQTEEIAKVVSQWCGLSGQAGAPARKP